MRTYWLWMLWPSLVSAQEPPNAVLQEPSPIQPLTMPETSLSHSPTVRLPRHFGVQFDVGVSAFLGDLAQETHAPTYNVQLKFLYLQSQKRPLYAYLSVNALWTQVIHTGDQFIHDPGATVHILSFLYVVTLCGNPSYGRFHFCAGLGEGTVNTNSVGNRQDLGTWNYHGQLQYDLTARASVMLSAKFVGRLEQQVDFVDAAFSFASVMVGPQYVF